MAKRNVLHRVESLWFKFTASISFFQFTLLCHNHRVKNIRIQTFFFWSVYSHLQTEYGNLQYIYICKYQRNFPKQALPRFRNFFITFVWLFPCGKSK